jgi:hypothetical protein
VGLFARHFNQSAFHNHGTLYIPGLWWVTAFATNVMGQKRISPPVWFKVRPANDDFINSIVLTGTSWGLGFGFELNVRGSTQFASAEAGEPAHGATSAVATVWYSWTAPNSGTAHFYYRLYDPRTVIATLQWQQSDPLQLIPHIHIFGNSFDVFDAVKGTTYRFAVSASVSDLDEYAAGFAMGLELVWPLPPTISILPSNPAEAHVVISGISAQRFVIENPLTCSVGYRFIQTLS